MATYTVKVRNSGWGMASLRDGFSGSEETSEDVSFLVGVTLDRFAKRMRERGSDCFWQPSTSELIGPVDEEVEPEILEGIRDDVIAYVWQDWCDGELTREESE